MSERQVLEYFVCDLKRKALKYYEAAQKKDSSLLSSGLISIVLAEIVVSLETALNAVTKTDVPLLQDLKYLIKIEEKKPEYIV